MANKCVLTIDGMSCGHCSARVEKALNSLPGVKAKVDLASKTASVKGCDNMELLKKTVTELGFTVTGVK